MAAGVLPALAFKEIEMATSTPWGVAQSVQQITQGIRSVSTAGHGGILVAPTKNALIPEYMRCEDGAYEEDCDWAIPAVVFESEWRKWADGERWTTGDSQMEAAYSTLKNWHPDAFERFTGRHLEPGESLKRDEALFEARNVANFVVRAAWGDYHEKVPTGMVGVFARRSADGAEQYFLVPDAEYSSRKGAFVIDPARHTEIGPI